MRQLLQKIALLLAIASLAACSSPQSVVSHLSNASAHLGPSDTIVGNP